LKGIFSSMNNGSPALVLDNVTKRFDDFVAVRDLSFTVKPGRVFGLIGPNGAGKTTTIRMIVNITIPDSGQITLSGKVIGPSTQDLIGYLPEERGLYKRMKVFDQLRFFGELRGMRPNKAKEVAAYWLDKVKLSEWKDHKSTELSKGMQQKIQFIIAVMHDPQLLIFDELFSGLDPVNAELMKDLLLELKAAGKTIIFSTHLMEQAEKLCDDICLINRSRKVLDGSLRDIKKSFGKNIVALRIDGVDSSPIENPNLVKSIKEHSDYLELLMVDGADSQVLLRELIASGARIHKFEEVEPSLHDIFIQKVGE
jgi:ABC-2 type transport system ATP-binding protein